ncbi:hypothetical protein CVS40_12866 [Lucilia cuprina]|nr:hypothetical protein CVS40_12866 [Lucilia cuprina]
MIRDRKQKPGEGFDLFYEAIIDISDRFRIPLPEQVYELYEDDVETSDKEITAISLVCWNCQKSVHRFQDCLDERRVFCYGCGAANAYKPTCTNCTGSKNLRSSAPGRLTPTPTRTNNLINQFKLEFK